MSVSFCFIAAAAETSPAFLIFLSCFCDINYLRMFLNSGGFHITTTFVIILNAGEKRGVRIILGQHYSKDRMQKTFQIIK